MSWTRVIRENRATLVCGLVVAALLGVLALVLRPTGDGTPLVALVHDGDGQMHELPLDRDARLEVTTSLGTNVVAVQDGAVFVQEADCPAGTCLRERPLTEPGRQIICLPHQLWIEVVPQGEDGGTMDVSLAEGTGDAEADVDLQVR